MRLFTAIDLPPEVTGRLDGLIAKLRPLARIGWSPAANLHITTKFVGQWPEERVAELQRALANLGPRAPIPIRVSGLGFFPNRKSPRVFWAGVHGGDALSALVKQIDAGLAQLGIAAEDRAFNAHLTLARIKEPAPLQALRSAIAQLDSVEFGSFTVNRFHLYRSQPGSAGSIYTKLSEYPFQVPLQSQ